MTSNFNLRITSKIKPCWCCNFLLWFFDVFEHLLFLFPVDIQALFLTLPFLSDYFESFMFAGSIVRLFINFFKVSISYVLSKMRLSADLLDASDFHRWFTDAYITRYLGFSGTYAVFEISFSSMATDGSSMAMSRNGGGHGLTDGGPLIIHW